MEERNPRGHRNQFIIVSLQLELGLALVLEQEEVQLKKKKKTTVNPRPANLEVQKIQAGYIKGVISSNQRMTQNRSSHLHKSPRTKKPLNIISIHSMEQSKALRLH